MIPGELHALLERCRAEEAPAWERFAAWVVIRGRAVLRGVDRLSTADGEDALAETLKSLVTVVRRGEIRGVSNSEIDAYVCTAIRNRALNALRGRTRRGEIDGWLAEPPSASASRDEPADRVADAAPSQDARVIAAEMLERAETVLLSWPPEDRYLFIAKLNGVSARVIQQTLEHPPFEFFTAVTTVDTRFHRLRKRLIEEVLGP